MLRDCPECQKTLTRIRRKPWMRLLPGSKHYVCRQCGDTYLLIFGRWLLKRGPHSHQSAGSRGA